MAFNDMKTLQDKSELAINIRLLKHIYRQGALEWALGNKT